MLRLGAAPAWAELAEPPMNRSTAHSASASPSHAAWPGDNLMFLRSFSYSFLYLYLGK